MGIVTEVDGSGLGVMVGDENGSRSRFGEEVTGGRPPVPGAPPVVPVPFVPGAPLVPPVVFPDDIGVSVGSWLIWEAPKTAPRPSLVVMSLRVFLRPEPRNSALMSSALVRRS
ncbi:hypothetical protein ABZX40_39575, partial [Streptomyces sp. NPDC004610]|uniref:hypothetical protein n=1 Tax=unclassified Streptomyces TaxID=2593676 RepID=UPI0033BF54E4